MDYDLVEGKNQRLISICRQAGAAYLPERTGRQGLRG